MNFAKLSAVSLLLTISVFSGFSQAIEKGDWIVRGGYTNINPASNNGEVVNLGINPILLQLLRIWLQTM